MNWKKHNKKRSKKTFFYSFLFFIFSIFYFSFLFYFSFFIASELRL
jgi:hypothetical protein